jgi:hypothetical protein
LQCEISVNGIIEIFCNCFEFCVGSSLYTENIILKNKYTENNIMDAKRCSVSMSKVHQHEVPNQRNL